MGTGWWCSDMVCSCPLDALTLGFPGWYRPRSAATSVFPSATLTDLKQFEMAATCAGLGDSQVKPSCEYRLAGLVLT